MYNETKITKIMAKSKLKQGKSNKNRERSENIISVMWFGLVNKWKVTFTRFHYFPLLLDSFFVLFLVSKWLFSEFSTKQKKLKEKS